ncbi:MAG: GPR endopeptidase [Bacilli bacterium]|nr:GPR endopeptidase [Bacilli bacterium]
MENQKINFSLRTDLAYDSVKSYESSVINGLIETKEVIKGVEITKHIVKEQAREILNKAPGIYYTIDINEQNYHDHNISKDIENIVAGVLLELIESRNLKGKKALVVGLGNANITPDAIGPYVVDNIVVTRHLDLNDELHSGYSVVSAISPGVMGTTGIETYDIIEAVRNKINIDYIIVVDALCSSSIARVNKTIQITDTGIQPGSGVGNKRKEISFNTMRIPVFAVGIPTVVDAVTIASNTLDYVIKYLNLEYNNMVPSVNKLSPNGIGIEYDNVEEPNSDVKEHFLGQIGLLNQEELKVLFQDVLTPNGYNLMVTSKDIDAEVEDLSKIVAWGINKALHENFMEEI